MINLNFANVPSREVIPSGRYVASIVKAEEKKATSGNTYIAMQLQILDYGDGKRMVWDNLTICENMMWRVKQFADAVGIDEGDLDVLDLVGLQVQVVLEVVAGQNEGDDPQNKIKKFYSMPF